jgi:hypothetical protein
LRGWWSLPRSRPSTTRPPCRPSGRVAEGAERRPQPPTSLVVQVETLLEGIGGTADPRGRTRSRNGARPAGIGLAGAGSDRTRARRAWKPISDGSSPIADGSSPRPDASIPIRIGSTRPGIVTSGNRIAPSGVSSDTTGVRIDPTRIRFGTTGVRVDQTRIRFGTTRVRIDPARIRFGTTGVRIDPAGIRFGTTGVRIDPTRIRFGTTGVRIDPTGIRFGTTGVRIDPTRIRFDVTGFSFDPAGVRFDPIRVGFDPTRIRSDPTGFRFDTAGFRFDPSGFRFDPPEMLVVAQDAGVSGPPPPARGLPRANPTLKRRLGAARRVVNDAQANCPSGEGVEQGREPPSHGGAVCASVPRSQNRYSRYRSSGRGVPGCRVTFATGAASGGVAAASRGRGGAGPSPEVTSGYPAASGGVAAARRGRGGLAEACGVCSHTPEARYAARSRDNAGHKSWPSRGSGSRLASGGGKMSEREDSRAELGVAGLDRVPCRANGPINQSTMS